MMQLLYERNSFEEIVERIKDVISKDYNRRIYDKDVAKELNLKPITVTIYKSTNRLPLNNLAYFCKKRQVSLDWLLFDKSFIKKSL